MDCGLRYLGAMLHRSRPLKKVVAMLGLVWIAEEAFGVGAEDLPPRGAVSVRADQPNSRYLGVYVR
jgi:hypothetical protein